MRTRTLLATILFSLLLPSSAFAFDLNVAAGVKGGMNGSVVNGVPEGDTFLLNGQPYAVPQGPDLYAEFGLGGQFGATLEVRALDLVGIETGIYQSYDNGNGWEDKNDQYGRKIGRINQEQRTTALHIPLLAKASVPGFVRPTFGLGIDIIKQNKSTLKYRSDVLLQNAAQINQQIDIHKSTYVCFAFSFALEVDLGPVRIPIELHGDYNTGFRKDLSKRTKITGTPSTVHFDYDGKYQGHFSLMTGIVYDYDFKF